MSKGQTKGHDLPFGGPSHLSHEQSQLLCLILYIPLGLIIHETGNQLGRSRHGTFHQEYWIADYDVADEDHNNATAKHDDDMLDEWLPFSNSFISWLWDTCCLEIQVDYDKSIEESIAKQNSSFSDNSAVFLSFRKSSKPITLSIRLCFTIFQFSSPSTLFSSRFYNNMGVNSLLTQRCFLANRLPKF